MTIATSQAKTAPQKTGQRFERNDSTNIFAAALKIIKVVFSQSKIFPVVKELMLVLLILFEPALKLKCVSIFVKIKAEREFTHCAKVIVSFFMNQAEKATKNNVMEISKFENRSFASIHHRQEKAWICYLDLQIVAFLLLRSTHIDSFTPETLKLTQKSGE